MRLRAGRSVIAYVRIESLLTVRWHRILPLSGRAGASSIWITPLTRRRVMSVLHLYLLRVVLLRRPGRGLIRVLLHVLWMLSWISVVLTGLLIVILSAIAVLVHLFALPIRLTILALRSVSLGSLPAVRIFAVKTIRWMRRCRGRSVWRVWLSWLAITDRLIVRMPLM